MSYSAGLSNHLGTPDLCSRRPEYEITRFDPGNKTDNANRRCNFIQRATLSGFLTEENWTQSVNGLRSHWTSRTCHLMDLFLGPRSPMYFPESA